MRTSRMISAAVFAAVAFLAVGCGTPSLPHVGVSSPYYGHLKGGSGATAGEVNNSDTFSACSLSGGPVKVTLGQVYRFNGGPFFVSINGTAGLELDATGDSVTSASVLTPGDCFSVVVSSAPYIFHNTCINALDPFCTPGDSWVSDGADYLVTW